MNQRVTQEMNDLMSSVSSQIQKAISETIREQFLHQIQTPLKFGQGQVPRKGWNVPVERPEYRSEETFDRKIRSCSRDEFPRSLTRRRGRRGHHLHAFLFCDLTEFIF